MPFILARSLRNGTKDGGRQLCVCKSHMQGKVPLLPLHKEWPILVGMGDGHCWSTRSASTCTPETREGDPLHNKDKVVFDSFSRGMVFSGALFHADTHAKKTVKCWLTNEPNSRRKSCHGC